MEGGGRRPGETEESSCCGREEEERDTLIGREGTLLPDRHTTKRERERERERETLPALKDVLSSETGRDVLRYLDTGFPKCLSTTLLWRVFIRLRDYVKLVCLHTKLKYAIPLYSIMLSVSVRLGAIFFNLRLGSCCHQSSKNSAVFFHKRYRVKIARLGSSSSASSSSSI
jgi:hypothetical protein